MIATPADCKASTSANSTLVRIALILLAWCWLGLLPALAADKSPNSACLECHSDKTLTKTNAAGKEVSLFVDEARLKATVHKTNTCTDCHADITSKHPDDNVPAQPPSCVKCHEKEPQGLRHQHPRREPHRWALPARPVAGIATARTTCSPPRIPTRRSSS